MRKTLIGLAVLAGVLVVALGSLFYAAFGGNRPILDGYQVGTGVRQVKAGLVSAFLVDVDAKHVALIDTGGEPKAPEILAVLKGRGLGPEAVTTILLTHGHPDHAGGCPAFPRAVVAALGSEVALAEGQAGGKGPLTRLFPVRPTGLKITRVLTDGEVVHLGSVDVRVFAVPGHTAGSAAFLVNGALIFGDAANGRKDGTLGNAKWITSDDAEQARESLKSLAGRLDPQAVTTLAFSHTGPLIGVQPLLDFASRR